MTQEASIKWKNEIKAFQEGKQIQIFIRNEWVDDNNPSFSIKSKYRVKPEETKRLPTIEEVEKWFLENRVFKDFNGISRIEAIIFNVQSSIVIDDECYTIENFCKNYTRYDGSSLYITE